MKLFKDIEIQPPFIDLRQTEFGKANKVNFGIDAFLFLEKIMYMKNCFVIRHQDENDYFCIRIFRKYPELKIKDNKTENKLNHIDIKIPMLDRQDLMQEKTKDADSQFWADKEINNKLIVLSELHKYIVLLEKARMIYFANKECLKSEIEIINSFIKNENEVNWGDKYEIQDYMKYYEKLFSDYKEYPYYCFHQENSELENQKIIEIIYPDKNVLTTWKE